MLTRWMVRRVDDRLRMSKITRTGMNKIFPDHWSFMMGEIALYAFVYLVISGIFLTFFFEASTAKTDYEGSYAPLRGVEVSAAYKSVVQISLDVRLGLVIRQSHHWAALIFIGAILVHLCRNFFTGAFRRPREINWMVGVTLLLLAIVNGFAGYSLPDDLLSETGLRVANAIMLSVPVVGMWISFLFFGGEFPGDGYIRRLYSAHILILPALIAGLLALHLFILTRQKHSQFPGPGRTETNVVGSKLWPSYAVRSTGLQAAVIAVCLFLGGLVQINPIWLWGPSTSGATIAPAQPDWYISWIEGALRLWFPLEPRIFGYRLPAPFWPGVFLPLVTFLLLYLWPFIERRFTKDYRAHQILQRPRERPVRVGVGVFAISFYVLLTATFSDDIISRYTGVPVYTLLEIFRFAVPFLSLLLGIVAWLLARALRDSESRSLLQLTWKDLTGSLRRTKTPPKDTVPPPEGEVIAHLPIETTGAVRPRPETSGPVGPDERSPVP